MDLSKKEITALLFVLNCNGSGISEYRLHRCINVCYPITCKYCKSFESLGLIISKKEGRCKNIFITKKGIDICKNLLAIKNA